MRRQRPPEPAPDPCVFAGDGTSLEDIVSLLRTEIGSGRSQRAVELLEAYEARITAAARAVDAWDGGFDPQLGAGVALGAPEDAAEDEPYDDYGAYGGYGPPLAEAEEFAAPPRPSPAAALARQRQERAGTFEWLFFGQLLGAKLFRMGVSSFLQPMMEFWALHTQRAASTASPAESSASANRLAALVSCVPPPEHFRVLLAQPRLSRDAREVQVMKAALIVLEAFHLQFGGPLFAEYQAEVVPLLLAFYKRTPRALLQRADRDVAELVPPMRAGTAPLFLPSRDAYVEHYTGKARELRLLTMGVTEAHYIL